MHDENPESLKRAVVEMTAEEFKYFSKAHNYYINGAWSKKVADEVVLVINRAFCETEAYLQDCKTELEKKYFGKWKPGANIIDLSDVSKLIFCGFYL